MEITQVCGVYWSATGNTRRTVEHIAQALAEALGCPCRLEDITPPGKRARTLDFAPGELAVVGSPTYAGKLPNKILPEFQTKLRGNGALAVGVVTFGNRSFDNSLAELCAVLEAGGFHTVAAGAFVGRHAFTDKLADGRPDWGDRREMADFAKRTAEKVKGLTELPGPVAVPGDASAPYYVPKGTDGQPAKFLKAKPLTDLSRCCGCGVCARVCPMGAIDQADVSSVPGTCIKCQACIRRCTRQAKYFEDPAFLSHVAMLEQSFAHPKQNQVFL